MKYILVELDVEGHDPDADWQDEVREALWQEMDLGRSEIRTADVTDLFYLMPGDPNPHINVDPAETVELS